MPTSRRVFQRQLEILLAFAEANKDIALGRCCRGPQANQLLQRAWETVSSKLNSVADGVTKTPEQWRRYWVELKAKTKAKGADIRRNASRTGGGPNKIPPLNVYEERILHLIGCVCVEGLPGVQIPFPILSTTTSTSQSTASTSQSTASTSQPTASTSQSTASTSQPTASTSQPTASTSQPTASTSQSTASTSQPTASTSQSTASTSQSTASTSQSTASTSQSTASTSQPTASTSQSTASTSQSTASISQPTASTSQSTASTSQPTASTSQSTASTSRPTASTSQSTASNSQPTASTSWTYPSSYQMEVEWLEDDEFPMEILSSQLTLPQHPSQTPTLVSTSSPPPPQSSPTRPQLRSSTPLQATRPHRQPTPSPQHPREQPQSSPRRHSRQRLIRNRDVPQWARSLEERRIAVEERHTRALEALSAMLDRRLGNIEDCLREICNFKTVRNI